MKTIKSTYAKNRIKELSNNITKYWNIIKTENVVSKESKRNYDLKAVYNEILNMSEERVLMKLYLQCINMGFKKFSELSPDSIYITIFKLSEYNERNFHLSKVRTLDPRLKRAKGKKNLKYTEELTVQFINAEKSKLQMQINELVKKLDDFNNDAELDTEIAPLALAA